MTLSRRDFLKLGGLAAMSAPVVNVIGRVGDYQVLESPAMFGGFWIKVHDPNDPPYELDMNIFERKPGTDSAFGRNPDKIMLRMQNTNKNIASGKRGDDWLAYAYANAAATFMFDQDMYAWEGTSASPSTLPEGKWVPTEHGYTNEEASKIMKRAAKMYGASLAGIAPLNPLWFYACAPEGGGPLEMIQRVTGGSAPPVVGAVSPEVAQLRQVLGRMEAEEFKTLMLDVMENADTTNLPMPPAMLKLLPATQFQEKMPDMLGNMDGDMLAAIKAELDPRLFENLPEVDEETPAPEPTPMPAGPPEGVDMGALMAAMAKDIVFSDEVDSPVITEDAKIIPITMNRLIVMAFEMDEASMNMGGNDHVICTLGEAAAQNGYSRMAFTSACLANMIRQLGWQAIPMGNDHSLSIPMAIDAGLGELGRNGILITPKYGPRVRLAKVLTDMPLVPDKPISFGVTEFCDVCGKCTEQCPGSAIWDGERTYDAPDAGNPGVLNWPVDGDICFGVWAEVGGSCYNCIRVCPFNKPEGWLHDATRILIGAKSGSLDKLLLKLDDASGYGGKGIPPEKFWDIDTYVHVKG
jgi:reductive dehalogenase